MFAQLCEYTKVYSILQYKLVNYIEMYYNTIKLLIKSLKKSLKISRVKRPWARNNNNK